eukprot:6369267-Pyramimonas_sp.AAC.1
MRDGTLPGKLGEASGARSTGTYWKMRSGTRSRNRGAKEGHEQWAEECGGARAPAGFSSDNPI